MVHCDDLDPAEQAAERARWSRAIDETIAALDLAAEFEAMGSPYSECDAQGRLITHYPSH